MPKFVTAAAFALMIAIPAFFNAAPVRADANAPVCAMLYVNGGPFQECDFYTYEQCRATTSGRGGSCFDNPTYRESLNRSPRGSRSRQ